MAHTITAQELTTLSTKAIDAKATAYCPYSKFRVGACILTASGEFITGANVENASYPVGTCAERVTIGAAIVAGHRDFKALAVATDIKPAASPCGMCRQFIREFTSPSFPVYMYDGEGNHKVMTMEEVGFLSFFSFLFGYISVLYLVDSLLISPVAPRLFRPQPS
ncbi:Pc16g01040 [Penicillium rubens Wisconsin 54-1255]|uniref:Cytidine deaminase n=1 Tax=Penicillium rubens (strain ATCC 28089 / DSM 1075 / NRRL 1951 / Wisconsin 54-1255) TaxID=500485 RepID=B6H713_PENRW|nr:Pc16g01040 [Penicillium rubens Wisconsin 54-1255]